MTEPTPWLQRQREARRDLESTGVGPRHAALFVGCVLGVLLAVPLAQLLRGDAAVPWGLLARGGEEAAAILDQQGLLAADRRLLAAIDAFESRLEEGSWVTAELLPPVQAVLTAALGAGNPQVVAGRDGWLLYRPAVDHLVGPPFLAPDVLRDRALASDSWAPVRPDPRPALRQLAGLLRARGIRLVLLPVPGKAEIQPDVLLRDPPLAPLTNPSFPDFVAALAAEGIASLDVAPALAAATADGPVYLRTDSHWRPGAVERTAAAVAGWIEREVGPLPGPAVSWRAEPRTVRGRGDLAQLLRLPPGLGLYGPEEVVARAIVGPAGEAWEPHRDAAVLLLGDSFTNVYSQAGLGWGRSAGLGAQLAAALGRHVDVLAVNAGGAHGSREMLARQLAADPERLAGKLVVVYQVARRELSGGDWRLLPDEAM